MKKITLTAAAKQHLSNYLKEHDSALAVRFSIRKSGCSGFRYVADVIEHVAPDDIKICDQPLSYVAPDSLQALSGMEIDHKVTSVGSELVYNNPNARDICGCGESFRVEDDKET